MKYDYQKLLDLYDQIEGPVIAQRIKDNTKKIQPLWKQKYDIIKDSSWPDCNNMDEFYQLPEHIQNECATVHNFSPEIWLKNIHDDASWKFILPSQDIQHKILSKHLDIIRNKKIVDFACRFGRWGISACELGAKNVVGFDIRDANLVMANATKEFLEISNDTLRFVKLDIYDYDAVTELCKNTDTAIIAGIFYHVDNHFQILQSVARAKVEHILIETGEYQPIIDSDQPLVWWKTEPVFDDLNGWNGKDSKEMLVGYPNLAWFNLAFKQLGYQLESNSTYQLYGSRNNPEEFQRTRSVHVYKKLTTA